MFSQRVKIIILFLLLLVLAGGYWLLSSYIELGKPDIKLSQDILVIGRQKVIDVHFSDGQSGLRDTVITLTQEGRTYPLYDVHYAKKGTLEKTIALTLDPLSLKMKEGPAVLTLKAVDHSLFKNQTVVSKPLTIDLFPPQIYLQNPQNIINPGGACVTLFRTSKPVVTGGIQVDNLYFPGYQTLVAGKSFHIVYFSLPINASQGTTRIKAVVKDQAGNESSLALPHLIKAKKFRQDKMNLSNAFLQQKMPDFQMMDAQLRGKTLIETFIYVNGTMRQENFKTIQSVTGKSEPRQLWSDTFLRMKNASPMALFGDRRTYMSDGKAIGESLHEGVDLASLEHAPIEAANSGIVVFAGPLGIYGNAVIIDHGFGLFTLYGHHVSLSVKAGQAVKRGDVIGNSGTSGLAGGDHLHFGVLVGGQFVNPQEWWDPHWIADNVTKKMAMAN